MRPSLDTRLEADIPAVAPLKALTHPQKANQGLEIAAHPVIRPVLVIPREVAHPVIHPVLVIHLALTHPQKANQGLEIAAHPVIRPVLVIPREVAHPVIHPVLVIHPALVIHLALVHREAHRVLRQAILREVLVTQRHLETRLAPLAIHQNLDTLREALVIHLNLVIHRAVVLATPQAPVVILVAPILLRILEDIRRVLVTLGAPGQTRKASKESMPTQLMLLTPDILVRLKLLRVGIRLRTQDIRHSLDILANLIHILVSILDIKAPLRVIHKAAHRVIHSAPLRVIHRAPLRVIHRDIRLKDLILKDTRLKELILRDILKGIHKVVTQEVIILLLQPLRNLILVTS